MRILLLTPIGASLITLALEKQGYDLIVAVLLETLSEVAGIYLFFRDRKRKRLAREKFEATFPDEASYVFLAENSD